ncbi:MAG: N-acetylmuramoyl-L-alanine amidase [Nitrospirae bacterium]|nr:N-acetylmuramoyl-L-alanine amidase [Nitrospirota bacterium]
MKKGLYITLILLCVSASVAAERTAEVLLRFSRQDTVIKIVLESDENVIRNANITASAAGVKIDFISPFDLKKPQDFMFETARDAHTLTIKFKDVTDAKTYKLSSPARIVLELKVKPQDPGQKQQGQNEPQKQQKDTGTAPQKTLPPSPQQSTQKAADAGKPQGQPQSTQKSPEPVKTPDRALKFSTLVIDPGHGGYDYGIDKQELKEKEISLNIAKDLAGTLQKKGLKVLLTRRVDQALPLGERINISNSKPPDLFITIHATLSDKFVITTATADEGPVDAAIRPYKLSARQTRHLDKSRAAAKALAEALKTEFKTETIARELPLPILTSIDAAAVLIEYPLAGQKTYDQKERDRLINAIIKGLAGYE